MSFTVAAKKVYKPLIASFVVAFSLLTLVSCSNEEFSYPKATKGFFVNDFAEVIDPEDEKAMQSAGQELYEKTKEQGGAQVVVATVNSLEGKDLESYSIELAREWGIGGKENNNGILLLLALEERAFRVEVGSGLEGALNDAKTGRITDTYGMGYFRKDEFSKGLKNVYTVLINEVYKEYGIEVEDKTPEQPEEQELQDKFGVEDIISIVLIAVIVIGCLVVNVLVAKKRGGGRGGRGGPPPFIFFGGPGFGGGRGGFGSGGFSGGGGGFSGGGSSRRF